MYNAPVYLVNHTKTADDFADMWDGSLDATLNIDQNGQVSNGTIVFTGSIANGIEYVDAPVGTSYPTRAGYSDRLDATWINGLAVGWEDPHQFYALSEKITVGIPEPGTMSLLMLGLVGVLAHRRRIVI